MNANPANHEVIAQDRLRSCAATDAAHRISIQFYHLTTTPIERALPKLVEKAYGAGHRVLLVESLPERLDMFNQVLWTYSTLTFLPHGSVTDGEPDEQPILLSPTADNRNQANVALITDGTSIPENNNFTRVLDIFDGNDKEAVQKARTRWKTYQSSGHTLTYMRQTDAGGWEEKQVA
jgi:DNA polymerase III subunit chi